MTAAWLDPVLVVVAVCLGLAVWAWWPVVEDMTGLTAADVANDADLPMWAVVVGGWSCVVMVVYVVWLGGVWWGVW